MVVTMQNVYIMMGLPGSGKTTWAKEKAKETGAVIIGRDDIRHMLKHSHDYDKSKRSQKYVWDVSQYMIGLALQRRFDVILDQLSLTKKQRQDTLKLVRDFASDACVTLVWCAEDKLNVDRRMDSDMAWGDREYYESLIKKLKDEVEEATYDEGFDHVVFVPGESNNVHPMAFKDGEEIKIRYV